jgi:hypothetical protein
MKLDVLLSAALLVAAAGPARAGKVHSPPPPPITIEHGADGAVFSGRLLPGAVDRFFIKLHEGDVLEAAVYDDALGEFNDPMLGVFRPSDATMPAAQNDDGGPGYLPRLSVRADESGLWTVAVTGFGDADFDGSGHVEDFGYRLVVGERSSGHRSDERNDPRSGHRAVTSLPLPHGTAVVAGTLVPGDVDVYEVRVKPGALLTASVFDEEGGEFNDSVLDLEDADGHPLAHDDDGGPGFLSNVLFRAPDTNKKKAVPVRVRLSGFDPDPHDARPHPESFAYRLLISLDTLDAQGSRGHGPPGHGEGSAPP